MPGDVHQYAPPLLSRNNLGPLLQVDSKKSNFNSAGRRLFRRPRSSKPWFSINLLVITFVAAAIASLVLACYRYARGGFGVGAVPRALVHGREPLHGACWGSDDSADEDSDDAEGNGRRLWPPQPPPDVDPEAQGGPGQPGEQLPITAGPTFLGGPPRSEAEDAAAATAADGGYPCGARPKSNEDRHRDPGRDDATPGDFRVLPDRLREYVADGFRRMRMMANLCGKGFAVLKPQVACEVVKVVSSLAAVELAVMTLLPPDMEHDRRGVVQKYIDLQQRALAYAAPGMRDSDGDIYINLCQLLKIFHEIKNPRRETKQWNPNLYLRKMRRYARVSRAAREYAIVCLHRLVFEGTARSGGPSGTDKQEELGVLRALFEIRLIQVLGDPKLRWSVVESQRRAKCCVLFSKKKLDTCKARPPLRSTVQEIDRAVSSARGMRRGLEKADEGGPPPGGHWQGDPRPSREWSAMEGTHGQEQGERPFTEGHLSGPWEPARSVLDPQAEGWVPSSPQAEASRLPGDYSAGYYGLSAVPQVTPQAVPPPVSRSHLFNPTLQGSPGEGFPGAVRGTRERRGGDQAGGFAALGQVRPDQTAPAPHRGGIGSAKEALWGTQVLPQAMRDLVRRSLRRLEHLASLCMPVLPVLGPAASAELVASVALLGAVELAAFSIVPRNLEPMRQAAVQRYGQLVDQVFQGDRRGVIRPETAQNLAHLLQRLRAVHSSRLEGQNLNAQAYQMKLSSIQNASQAVVQEVIDKLMLFPPYHKAYHGSLTEGALQQQLTMLSAVVHTHVSQVSQDPSVLPLIMGSQRLTGQPVPFSGNLQAGAGRHTDPSGHGPLVAETDQLAERSWGLPLQAPQASTAGSLQADARKSSGGRSDRRSAGPSPSQQYMGLAAESSGGHSSPFPGSQAPYGPQLHDTPTVASGHSQADFGLWESQPRVPQQREYSLFGPRLPQEQQLHQPVTEIPPLQPGSPALDPEAWHQGASAPLLRPLADPSAFGQLPHAAPQAGPRQWHPVVSGPILPTTTAPRQTRTPLPYGQDQGPRSASRSDSLAPSLPQMFWHALRLDDPPLSEDETGTGK